jgi:PTS system mannose-specific IIB component
VTVGWRQYLRYREIWVVDDAARQEPYVLDALRLAAPPGTKVRVMGSAEVLEVLTGYEGAESMGQEMGESVLMLLRDPGGVLSLVEGGVSFERVNVGNLGSRPGSIRAIKNVSLTRAHVEVLDALNAHGIEVFFQLTPEDSPIEWQAVRRRVVR